MTRFDDRLPPRGKVGDDFQRFVWEALRSGHFEPLIAGRYIRPYFAAGNDGAIDHLAIGDHDQIVVECKFFGKERKGQPAGDWKEVASTLGPNLIANAGRDIASVERHYKPWFDTERPVKGYWFCTSAVFQPGAQAELRQEISEFFSSLAQSHPSLAHFSSIGIEVLGWNDFDAVLNTNPPLQFRWFRQLPVGLRPLRSLTDGKTFRKFLDEGTLEFFSRDAFNREIGFDNRARLTDERSTLSILLESNDQTGLVLAGPGGVGKTRLALELGLAAEQSKWLVLQVERIASADAIEELARAHIDAAEVLLIIDYAEAATSLFALAHAMERVNRDGKHRIRFVATCRASALSVVKEALEDSAYQIIEFSGQPDDRYNNWVVNQILLSANVPQLEEISSVCGGVPAIAAFAIFLFRQYPSDFDAQFGQIHQGDDFAAWANKRLSLALSAQKIDASSTRRPLAALAARLPLPAEECNLIRNGNDEAARLLDLLQRDRWVESEGDEIFAAHDIFADAIVARYVFEAQAAITDRVADVFIDAADANAFERALIAINRLASHPQFGEIDGVAAVRRVHARKPSSVIAAHKALLRNRIPNYQTTIRLLDALPDLSGSIAADTSSDGLLGFLAESAAASKDDQWRLDAGRVLQPLLDRAVERTRSSNIVVRRALRLLPQRYRQQALAWVRAQPTQSDTHFLFVTWLLSGLPSDEIAPDLDIWLTKQGRTDPKASFVFWAWLCAAAELDKAGCLAKARNIEDNVLTWLGEHETIPDARFVYGSWLDAAAKLDKTDCSERIRKIEGHVLTWIEEHETNQDAQFVYQPWLSAAAKLDKADCLEKIRNVENHVLAWLAKHETSETAQFVYRSWLSAAAKLDKAECLKKIGKVEDHVFAWLPARTTDEDTQFIYKSWLDAAAKLGTTGCLQKIRDVEDHVFAWLAKHGKKVVAQFVYGSWLDAAAKLDKTECLDKIRNVENHALAWIEKHATDEVAQYVYRPWLDAGASPEVIRSWMLQWFTANPDYRESDFVIRAWLKATRDFAAVRIPALRWFNRNRKNPEAVYVLKFIVKERELPSETIEDIVVWCTTFPDTLDSICRIGPIVARFSSGALERPLIEAALVVLEHVQMSSFTDKGVRYATIATIGALTWKLRSTSGFEAKLDRIHANIFLNSDMYQLTLVPGTPSFVFNPAIAIHVAGMIKRKLIDPERDAGALERFADWLAAWPPERAQLLQPAMHMLEKDCAIPGLWDRVGILAAQQQEADNSDTIDLNLVLGELSNLQMLPSKWSTLWEKGWKRYPGDSRLVAVARQWLPRSASDPSWPFVWEPLFMHFPEDGEFTDVALWWLEHRGPQERGAWTFVWKLLWDHGRARDRLIGLGSTWLREQEGKHKYWTDVRARLNAD
jgi:hypothetical protein